MAPLLARNTILQAGVESTYGSSPGGGNIKTIRVREIALTPVVQEQVDRQLIRGYAGQFEQVLANQRTEITITCELANSGTAGTAPRWAQLLRACAMTETSAGSGARFTYAPTSSITTQTSVYLRCYIDGQEHLIAGCRGTFDLSYEVGQIPTITFSFTGRFDEPTTTGASGVTYATEMIAQPVRYGTTNGFEFWGSTALSCKSWSYSHNNTVIFDENIGNNRLVRIVDRKPTGSLTIEESSSFDTTNAVTCGDTGTNTLTHQGIGAAAGNKIVVSCPQSRALPHSLSVENEIYYATIPFNAEPSSAGNDEFKLELY